ncbi:MAG: metallophosphoesterase family protein [Anaerolineae bacterium]|nr:metallophosphoesterase family protein [Anaerolineae bacterium]
MVIPDIEAAAMAPLPVDLSSWLDFWHRLVNIRLTSVFQQAREVLFDDDSRLVFFSDSHRGDRSSTDLFAANETLFLRALTHYHQRGFTYVEVGDGDELWQNHRFKDVLRSHRPIFDLLHRFDLQSRLHLILGNHDVPRWRQDEHSKDGMQVEEALTLRHRRTGQRLLVTHGHQVDLKSDLFSPFSRLLVRHVWRRIQQWDIVQFFLPGLLTRHRRRPHYRNIERRLMAWSQTNHQAIICGHTHRAMAAEVGEPAYFNTGSVIVPGIATGLEIQGGEISLVRWRAHPLDHTVRRELLAPPRRLSLFA